MPCAISIQCVESGERADRIIATLQPDETLRFEQHDIVPFLYRGDDMEDGRRAAEERLTTIDLGWREVVRVL